MLILFAISCSPERLEERVGLVQQDITFTEDMSVRQTLLFHSFLREPGTLTRGRDTKGRINALIEDLGLSQVACHLLLDTDILVLDQVRLIIIKMFIGNGHKAVY